MENQELLNAMAQMFADKLEEAVGSKFETINQKFDSIDKNFEIINQKFDSVDKNFEVINKKFDVVDDRLSAIESKQDAVSWKLDCLSLDMKIQERDLKQDIRNLKDGQNTIITIMKVQKLWPKAL